MVGRENLGILRWSGFTDRNAPLPLARGGDPGGRGAARHTLVSLAGTLTEERVTEPVYGSAARTHFRRSWQTTTP